jgi:2-dehydro-3-deoxyglucarate aldolase/4-hydroxy-2-oxoheptanedioate aldolase
VQGDTVANAARTSRAAVGKGRTTTTGTLRSRVLAGETVFGTFIFGTSPLLVEVAGRAGLDWLLVDLEHGTAHESDLLALLMAAQLTPATPLVRVAVGERIRVGRALDLGAGGVMVPQVHSAEQASNAVRWMRTQPAGERGIALLTRGMHLGSVAHDKVAERHHDLLTIVQVESAAAVRDASAIAAVDGIDVLFVGPADLTHALGIPGRIDDPAYLEAVSHVARACREAGKAAGVMLWQAADVERYIRSGYTFFALASEANMLERAIHQELDVARRAAAPDASTEVP